MAGTIGRVRDKLRWAKEHVREVKELVEGLGESQDQPFRFKTELHAHGRAVVKAYWQTGRTQPTVNDIGHEITDAVHNLRATLDYLVWELTMRKRGSRVAIALPLDDPLRRVAFPIYLKEADYDGTSGRGRGAVPMLAGVRRDHRARIKALQPFDKPDHPLWVLAELDNLGKHRHAHVVVGLHTLALDPFFRKKWSIFNEGIHAGGAIKNQAKVAQVRVAFGDAGFDAERIESQVKVALKRTLSVTFAKGSPAEGQDALAVLRWLQTHTTKIVNSFAPDFPD